MGDKVGQHWIIRDERVLGITPVLRIVTYGDLSGISLYVIGNSHYSPKPLSYRKCNPKVMG